ncbi:MAG: hypothetical protein AAFR14_08895, partial [Bacteroidota bacterium]
SRSKGIVRAIREINPDIIALNEWRNNATGTQMRIDLLRLGYLHQVTSAAQSSSNTAFLASKFPCSSILYSDIDDVYSDNVVAGIFGAFTILSVYLPHKKQHRLLDWIIDEFIVEYPTSIIDMINTGINHVDQDGDSFWYTDRLESLATKGFRDAFRALHGDKREYSWYSHQGNGYRYDHSYASDHLLPLIQSCEYLHHYREGGLSDHSPMLLVLGS